MKRNQPALHEAPVMWVEYQWRQGRGQRWRQSEKGHGRMERREVWPVPCEEDMRAYLEREFGWEGVQWCGYIWRRRRRLHRRSWEAEKRHVWVAGAAFPWALDATTVAALLRTRWYDESRHAWPTGLILSGLRCLALTLLRLLVPAPYIADAQRFVAAMPDEGVALLTRPL